MHVRKSSNALSRAVRALVMALTAAVPAAAQQSIPSASVAPSELRGDPLMDALTCRLPDTALPALLSQLRQQRPDDFNQSYRQYSAPSMDLYRLKNAVAAWGQGSDSVLVSENRVMIAVEGTMDAVSSTLEMALQSIESPLGGALDEKHALVVMDATLPGLEGRVLLGCEYRIEGLSLLVDPSQAWRLHRDRPHVESAGTPSTP